MEPKVVSDGHSMSSSSDERDLTLKTPLLSKTKSGPLSRESSFQADRGSSIYSCNNPSSSSDAFLQPSGYSSEDLFSSYSPGYGRSVRRSLGLSCSLSDTVPLQAQPSQEYYLKGKMISSGSLTRIQYSPQIKSAKSALREFSLKPRPTNVLDLEKCHLFGENNHLKEDEMRILVLFDQLKPFVNPVRNEPDFQGKLKRLMNVCHILVDSTGPLRVHLNMEAQTLLKAIDRIVQETMSPIDDKTCG